MGRSSAAKAQRRRARTGTGPSPYASNGKPPAKIEGRHRWGLSLMYALTNTQAAAAMRGARVNLDDAPRVTAGVGCIDCRGEYQTVNGAPCVPGLATPSSSTATARTESGLYLPESSS